jgi:hypothetical protein
MDYNYFRKYRYDKLEELGTLDAYECLITAYVDSERVKATAAAIPCKDHWWVCDSGQSIPADYLKGARVFHITEETDGGISKALIESGYEKVCVDITGFCIPQMLVLFRFLQVNNFKAVDYIYTEPNQYKENEHTQFSSGFTEVKQVYGYRGSHNSDMDRDLLIIAAGYDHSRIIDVANSKKSAKKVLMFGFPPSSPGMFQENILRVHEAETAVGENCFINMDLNIYAPANDPFSTAQALYEYMKRLKKQQPTNIYFAPLSSKPQALGIALFYIWATKDDLMKEWSIIYPYCKRYMHNTTAGIARIWRYQIEFP